MKSRNREIDDLGALPEVIADIEKSEDCTIKAISFDIDGTLMDVTVISMVLAEAAVSVLADKGCRIQGDPDSIGAYDRVTEKIGKVRFGRWEDEMEIFQPTLSPGKSMTRNEAEQIVEKYNANFDLALRTDRFKDSLFPETIRVLTDLHNRNVKLFIHSGRYTDLARRQLASVGLPTTDQGGILFDICGGDRGDKVGQVRNHLRTAGVGNPREFLVVGDRQDDLDAATANGAHPVRIKHR
jgi:phosphoglycolate phosphatase-like HAD superfamily hydrolase